MRTSAELRGAAARAGLDVDTIELIPMPGAENGETIPATRMTFDDPWAAARLLQELADKDATDPVVRTWALEIMQAALEAAGAGEGPTLTPALRYAIAEAIHGNVQAQIRFIHEPKETFQAARVTMALGAGDCDDHGRLVYALARAAGLPAKLLFFEDDDQPIHVVSQIGDGVGFLWCETTIDAEFGEHPLDAYDRIGPDPAGNPMQGGIGFLGLDFVTPGDVQTRKTQLNAAVQSLNGDVGQCAAIDGNTHASWASFLASWNAFYADAPGFLNAGAQGRQAADFTDQIRDWQDRVGAVCKLSAAPVPAPKEDAVLGLVKSLAVVAVAGAVAWAVTDTGRTIRVLRGGAR